MDTQSHPITKWVVSSHTLWLGVIVCPCWDRSWTVLVKGATGVLSCARSLPHLETRFPRFHGHLVFDGLRNLACWTEPVRLAKIRFSRALYFTWLLNQLPFCCAHEVCELLFVCLFVLFICRAVVPPGTGVGPCGGFCRRWGQHISSLRRPLLSPAVGGLVQGRLPVSGDKPTLYWCSAMPVFR